MNGMVFDHDTCEIVPLMVSLPCRGKDYIRVWKPSSPRRITSRDIVAAVAEYYDLTVDEICSPSHAWHVSHPRQLGMYLCRKLTKLSFSQITAAFGRSDHTTALNACKVVQARLRDCPATAEAYRVLREGLA